MFPWRGRALSNTIAGLIVLTFLIVVFVPLIINMLTTTTQGSIKLAQSLIQKIAESAPILNVTYNPSASNPPITRVYDVINTDTQDHTLTLMTIEDANGQLYMVKPGACIATACTAGTASVKVILIDNAVRLDDRVLLHPRGMVRVEVEYGKLLGILLYSGAYAKVLTPPPAPATNATVAQYAAVAGSVKTNYFELSSFKDLADIINSPDVVLTTDPASDKSDKSILWRNMIQSRCYVNGKLVTGGFQPMPTLNDTQLDGLLMYNIEIYGGTFILGGGGGQYNEYPFTLRMLASGYGFSVPDVLKPGLIVAKKGDSWGAVFLIPGYAYSVLKGSDETIHNFINAFITQHSYKYMLAIRGTNVARVRNTGWSNALLLFDIPHWGLVINYTYTEREYGIRITHYKLIYCPISSDDVAVQPSGNAVVTADECYGIHYKLEPSWGGYSLYIGVIQMNATIYIDKTGYNGDAGKGEIWGMTRADYVQINDYYEYLDVGVVSENTHYDEPFRLKIEGYTTNVTVYDYARETTESGKDAFGFYYYNGYRGVNAINVLALRNVKMRVFQFTPGDTSGVEPFSYIIDTDGNTLLEIVFTTEDIAPGWSDTWDDLVRSVYIAGQSVSMKIGCQDKTINQVYLKFVGPQYAVNGSEIAQVSIQIRYTFHDNAGDDVDDVDDPKQYIMSFQLITPNGTIFMSSDYIYQQLQNLEDTWPPNSNWVSDSVFLLVPDENDLFYVAFAVNDPYGWESKDNDPDFTLAVEWLGMWYLHR